MEDFDIDLGALESVIEGRIEGSEEPIVNSDDAYQHLVWYDEV